MRLFASIRPPEEVREHLVTALRPVRDDHGPLLRWTDPDQWHLTVAFYGERPDGSVDELAGHIAAAAATTELPDALDLHLRGAGSFSGRTLWIGVGGDVAPLRDLMAACAHDPFADPDDPGVSDGSAARERRRAHLTVARLRAREQGGRRDGRRAHRRSAWAGDRRRGRSREGGYGSGGYGRDGGHGRDLARPARHDGADVLRDVVHALSVYSGPSWSATEIELVSSRLGEGRSGGALHDTVATIPLHPSTGADH
ncbi:RNA 2',3'-cyclic phosphodiesterase [Corynebacterium hansenii]|uniref:RNA 2',3'-cyclic phosphodiesterase n=1 Tax=Corynebacterium hansenii TaxID=394964 RepID=A0ABV7ZQW9_9CORY|nr:RNA 2',3'-cyclic phosphodiesterase [Corynebacterium hansenii]WJZ01254.1 2',5' RNA ligase family [Corynebacterium hansenii]